MLLIIYINVAKLKIGISFVVWCNHGSMSVVWLRLLAIAMAACWHCLVPCTCCRRWQFGYLLLSWLFVDAHCSHLLSPRLHVNVLLALHANVA